MRHETRVHTMFIVLAVAAGWALPAHVASAQETRARVTGTITDSQGAVIPGVTVTATNTQTNVTTEAVTNEAGTYNLQQLVPGPYRITATLQGFKTFAREGIILHTAEVATVNVKLDVHAHAGDAVELARVMGSLRRAPIRRAPRSA